MKHVFIIFSLVVSGVYAQAKSLNWLGKTAMECRLFVKGEPIEDEIVAKIEGGKELVAYYAKDGDVILARYSPSAPQNGVRLAIRQDNRGTFVTVLPMFSRVVNNGAIGAFEVTPLAMTSYEENGGIQHSTSITCSIYERY